MEGWLDSSCCLMFSLPKGSVRWNNKLMEWRNNSKPISQKISLIFLIHPFISSSFLTGCFSGDNDHIMAIHQRKSRNPIFIYHHVQSVEKSLDMSDQRDYGHNSHLHFHAKISKLHPALMVKSAFSQPGHDSSLNLLAMTGEDQEVENLPIPAANVITVVSSFCLC